MLEFEEKNISDLSGKLVNFKDMKIKTSGLITRLCYFRNDFLAELRDSKMNFDIPICGTLENTFLYMLKEDANPLVKVRGIIINLYGEHYALKVIEIKFRNYMSKGFEE